MRLLSSNFSPFATRVRIQIRKKKLPIDICAPEPALRTPEFLAKYALGKIPVLELDDGSQIAESWAIMEYLEASYSDISLRPTSPLNIAHINMMSRFADLHLGPALFPIFLSLLTGQPIEQEKEISAIRKELDKGNRMLADILVSGPRKIHIGDIALACSMLFTIETPKLFGCENILDGFEHLEKWWLWVQQDADVKQGTDEMFSAFKAYLESKS